MSVLVDTSIWIDYFRGGPRSGRLDPLLEDGQVVINDLILTQLVPVLRVQRQIKVAGLLAAVPRLPLDIDWAELTALQERCLKAGHNGIGLPDFIIAQNARQLGCSIYSLDTHFRILGRLIGLQLHQP